ncbi:MAG: methyltransferase [bacterium]|jgi:release factor glutamine methyltransferase|nr:methyltransferase [bacterium]
MCLESSPIVASYHFTKAGGINIDVFPEVYSPREDTFLVIDNIVLTPNIRFLEIGVGTGLISIFAAKRGAIVEGTDINPAAVGNAKHNTATNDVNARFHCGDLFEGISGKFDLIVFNPPYLPISEGDKLQKWEEEALIGGHYGVETSIRFLEKCPEYMNRDCIIYLVLSSLGDTDRLTERFRDRFVFEKTAHVDFNKERLTLFGIKNKTE